MEQKVTLCLDGGGIKGISVIMILIHLLDKINARRTATNLETVEIHDLFDLIGGTSTGGLISLFVGVKKHSIRDALGLYLGGNPDRMRSQGLMQGLANTSRYSADALEDEYKDIYGEYDLLQGKGTKVPDQSYAGTGKNLEDPVNPKVMVTSIRVDRIPSETMVFRNYPTPPGGALRSVSQAYVWEAARATSAAPTFWLPYTRELPIQYDFSPDPILHEDYLKHLADYDINQQSLAPQLIDTDKKINSLQAQLEQHAGDTHTVQQLAYYINKKYAIQTLISDGFVVKRNKQGINYQKSKMKYQVRNSWVLVDGGFGINNPSLVMYADALSLKYSISYMLSIGTGHPHQLLKDNFLYSKYRASHYVSREREEQMLRILMTTQHLALGLKQTLTQFLVSTDRDRLKQAHDGAMRQLAEIPNSLADINLSASDRTRIINYQEQLNFLIQTIDTIPPNVNTSESVSLFDMAKYYPIISVVTTFKTFINGSITFKQLIENLQKIQSEEIVGKKLVLEPILSGVIQTLIELEQEAGFTDEDYDEFKKYVSRNVLVSGSQVLEQAKMFVKENIVEAITETTETERLIRTILSDKYERIDPIYQNDIDLGETNPLLLHKMMVETQQYILSHDEMLNKVATRLYELTKNKSSSRAVPYAIDQTSLVGNYIQRCIQYEIDRLYMELKIPVDRNRSFVLDLIYLDNLIDHVYRPYYEATYALLMALQNYQDNNILESSGDDYFDLVYLHPVTRRTITRSLNMDQIHAALLPLSSQLESRTYVPSRRATVDNQKGGLSISEFRKLLSKTQRQTDKLQRLREAKRVIDDLAQELNINPMKQRMDNIIINLLIKRVDSGMTCRYCKTRGVQKEHVCEGGIAGQQYSNTDKYWNTCLNLGKFTENIFSDKELTDQAQEFELVHPDLSSMDNDQSKLVVLSSNTELPLTTSVLDTSYFSNAVVSAMRFFREDVQKPEASVDWKSVKTIKIKDQSRQTWYDLDIVLVVPTSYSSVQKPPVLAVSEMVHKRYGINSVASGTEVVTDTMFQGLIVFLRLLYTGSYHGRNVLSTTEQKNIYRVVRSNSKTTINLCFYDANIPKNLETPIARILVDVGDNTFNFIETNKFIGTCSALNVHTRATKFTLATFMNYLYETTPTKPGSSVGVELPTTELAKSHQKPANPGTNQIYPLLYPVRRKKLLPDSTGFVSYEVCRSWPGSSSDLDWYYELRQSSLRTYEYYVYIAVKLGQLVSIFADDHVSSFRLKWYTYRNKKRTYLSMKTNIEYTIDAETRSIVILSKIDNLFDEVLKSRDSDAKFVFFGYQLIFESPILEFVIIDQMEQNRSVYAI